MFSSSATNLKSKTKDDLYYRPGVITWSYDPAETNIRAKNQVDQQEYSWLIGKIRGRQLDLALPFFSFEDKYQKLSCSVLPELNKVKHIAASSNNDLLAVTTDHKVHILIDNVWKEVTGVNEKFSVKTADIWNQNSIFFIEEGTGAVINAYNIWGKIAFWVGDFSSLRTVSISTYKKQDFLLISEKTSKISNGFKAYFDGTSDGYVISYSDWVKKRKYAMPASSGCMNENATYLIDHQKRFYFEQDRDNYSVVVIANGQYSYISKNVVGYKNHVGQDNVKCSPKRFAVQNQENKIMIQSKKNPQTLISPYLFARLWDLGDDNTIFVQGERQERTIKRCTIPDI